MPSRLARPLLASLVLALLLATPALAGGKPEKAPSPFPPGGIDIPAGTFLGCDFDMHVDAVLNTEFTITFPAEANGDVRQVIAGQLIIRVTNTWTGAWVDEKISGPGTLTFRPDGSYTDVFEGRSLPVQPGAGFLVTSGRVVQEFAADGSSTLGPIHGKTYDVCAAIS